MRILLVNDTSNDKNIGCQLTSHYLKEALKTVYPNAEIKYVRHYRNDQNLKLFDKVIINGEGSFSVSNLPLKTIYTDTLIGPTYDFISLIN